LLLLRNSRYTFQRGLLLRMISLYVYGVLIGQPFMNCVFLITIIVNKTGFAS